MSILFLLATCLLYFIPQAHCSLDLAKKYAPIITQEIGSHPTADEFTRMDYDGDWDPLNNWDNLDKFPHPAAVYWDVIESEHHYFITYAFFFPRDYSSICFWIHCHENDFEGMRVVIKKPDTLLRLEALAHNFHSQVEHPKSIHVMIEKGGHGVYPAAQREFDPKHKTFSPAQYELRPLSEIWEKRDSPLFKSYFDFRGQKLPASFGGSKWTLFGLGTAKPPWSWEIWRSSFEKGEWFLDPLKGTGERYINHPYTKKSKKRGLRLNSL